MRRQRGAKEHDRRQAESHWVGRGGLVQLTAEQTANDNNPRQPDGDADPDQPQSAPQHEAVDISPPRPERDADAELAPAAGDSLGRDAIETDGGHQQRRDREQAQQQHQEPP